MLFRSPKTDSVFTNAALRQAVSSTISQGVGVVTGLQQRFDWKSVAAGAVGAGVGASVGQALQSADAFSSLGGGLGTDLARGAVSGFAGGMVTAVMRGGRVSVQQVATDAFGNALGDSIAAANSSGDVLGDFIKKNDNWVGVSAAPTFAEDRAARLTNLNPYGLPTSSAAPLISDGGLGNSELRFGSAYTPDFSGVDARRGTGPDLKTDMSFEDSQSLASSMGLAGLDQRAPGVQVAMGPLAAFVGVGAGGAAGGVGVAGGYQSTRPNGVGGPPGYDIRTDMPSGSPGYSGLDPSVGFGAPPSQSESRSWMSNIISGPTPLGFLNNALENLVFSSPIDKKDSIPSFKDFNQAQGAALDWLESRGFKAEQPTLESSEITREAQLECRPPTGK